MWIRSMAVVIALLTACDDASTTGVKVESERSAVPARSAAPVETEPAPEGCKASGQVPVELGSALGHVYGFASDATHLYTSSWQLLGGRGDLGKLRKDGKGRVNLSSLSLEPRGLAVDGRHVFFTAGIRLMSIPKDGTLPKVLAETFSSQSIAADRDFVYGVPGDYGPYDRLIRAEKSSGKTKELDVSERPDAKQPPFGFSAIAVDATGIYVTDSSANRVLKFPLDRGKPKTLAARQDKAYDLAIDESNVYFTLAQAGQLMKVAKAGGTPTKLASGLADRARIAADGKGIFTTLAGEGDGPQTLVKITSDANEATPMATVPRGQTVEAIALDEKCLYWAEYSSDTQKAVIKARAR